MEIYEVVGFRKGNKVSGYTLFLQRVPDPDENITGIECLKVFVPSRYVSYVPVLGDRVRLLYNQYGKIGSVETC